MGKFLTCNIKHNKKSIEKRVVANTQKIQNICSQNIEVVAFRTE